MTDAFCSLVYNHHVSKMYIVYVRIFFSRQMLHLAYPIMISRLMSSVCTLAVVKLLWRLISLKVLSLNLLCTHSKLELLDHIIIVLIVSYFIFRIVIFFLGGYTGLYSCLQGPRVSIILDPQQCEILIFFKKLFIVVNNHSNGHEVESSYFIVYFSKD